MKLLLALGFLLSTSAFAQCPNLSGNYLGTVDTFKGPEDHMDFFLVIRQSSCAGLSIYSLSFSQEPHLEVVIGQEVLGPDGIKYTGRWTDAGVLEVDITDSKGEKTKKTLSVPYSQSIEMHDAYGFEGSVVHRNRSYTKAI